MAQCEANYWLLLKLTPGLGAREHWQFAVEQGASSWEMRIDVTERMRYTTTLRVSREDDTGSDWLQSPQLQVRLYHDANLAEVIAWEGHRRLEAKYEYPNKRMYQADEKSQFNRFLGEWLSHCLKNGHSLDDIIFQ